METLVTMLSFLMPMVRIFTYSLALSQLRAFTDRTLEAHYHHLPDAEWMEKQGKKMSKKQREARKTMTREIMEVSSAIGYVTGANRSIALACCRV